MGKELFCKEELRMLTVKAFQTIPDHSPSYTEIPLPVLIAAD